ncbi:metal-dependent hydrolase [Rheinheimera gaetbuli]
MDSLTQLTLGAAVAVATLGRQTPQKFKIAAAGAILGTLPDLDVLLDYGDVVSNMVLHRAQSHAFFYQTLLAPLLAFLAAIMCRQRQHYLRWLLATWLILISHSAIDAMTVYGTQLALPFNNSPYAVGSIFIIDPLYTLPLLLGVGFFLGSKNYAVAVRANFLGIALSSTYMLWTVVAQWQVSHIVRQDLAAQKLSYTKLLVTPAPLNTLLWRIVVMTEQGYAEGFYSLLDGNTAISWHSVATDKALALRYQHLKSVQQLAAFSRGFYSLRQQNDRLLLTDLRMGQEGSYAFEFIIDGQSGMPLAQLPMRHNSDIALPWLWRRALGQPLPSPYWPNGQ